MYVFPDVVVKVIAADRHRRFDREVALARHLPPGLSAPLLASGHREGIRYACYARVPGSAPGLDLPGLDRRAARHLAEQAVERLWTLHRWVPPAEAVAVLADPLDHGGFTTAEALLDAADHPAIPRHLRAGLAAIADRGGRPARTDVPVHADCFWNNWLVDDGRITALLDFEWARYGDPSDDWFFLARFSGRHRGDILDVVAGMVATTPDALRAECAIREAAHLVSDLRAGRLVRRRRRALEQLVSGRTWG